MIDKLSKVTGFSAVETLTTVSLHRRLKLAGLLEQLNLCTFHWPT
jgi:hypothetical protein